MHRMLPPTSEKRVGAARQVQRFRHWIQRKLGLRPEGSHDYEAFGTNSSTLLYGIPVQYLGILICFVIAFVVIKAFFVW